ncbi:unnamed protein product [Clonostachys rosea f. rosea IK726]|uniref:Uncharacterized protein n=2 Tax=Bionectria ochroleuca TaxID=29856 RepID=A0A0B7KFH3_BIOOC|nr:unnamed protein product [Clonostachys rosea f. rosea IK726]
MVVVFPDPLTAGFLCPQFIAMLRHGSVLTQVPVEVERRRSVFSVRSIFRSGAPERSIDRRNTNSSSGTVYSAESGDTEITIPIPEPREKGPDISPLSVNESSLRDTPQLLREAARTSQQFPASSPHIYQHQGRRKAKPWFGKPWEVRVPDILERKWSQAGGIKERLDLDLEPTRIQLTRKASKRKCRRSEREFNAELRMSGVPDPLHPHTITLLPHVWIFCGSEWALKVLEKALRSISWIEGFLNRPVEFCIGGIELCALETVIPLEQLQKHAVSRSSLSYRGGDVLFHIAELYPGLASLSACGWLCCATYLKDNTVRSQRLSRIGGILTTGILDEYQKHHLGTILTVAHGLLDEEEDDLDEAYSSYSDALSSDSESDSEDSYDSEESEMVEPLSGPAPRLGLLDPSEVVSRWIPFDEVCGINCFGKIVQNKQPLRDYEANRSDYALLRSLTLQNLLNTYTTPSTAQEAGSFKAITTYSSNSEMKDDRVCIILGLGQVEEAWLLPGFQTIHLEGGQVTVRKLQLRLPLAQGTSGSWVVKDHTWYGMIVAAYAGEPLAVFITAEDILSDMKSSFPSLGQASLGCSEISSTEKSSRTEGLKAIPRINEDHQTHSHDDIYLTEAPKTVAENEERAMGALIFSPSPWPSPTKPLPAPPLRKSAPTKPVKSVYTNPEATNDDLCHLFSTPYSFAAPKFRHGNIPFSKSLFSDRQLAMVDTLDWTAYEVAMLWSEDHDLYDLQRNREEYTEDFMDWFDSFGFQSHGGLVPETRRPKRSPSNHSTACSTSQSVPLDDTHIDYDGNEDGLSDVSDLEEIYKPDENTNDDLVETSPGQLPPENIYEIPEAIYAGFKRLQPEMDPIINSDVDNIYMDEDQGPNWYNTNTVHDFLEWERRYLQVPSAAPSSCAR